MVVDINNPQVGGVFALMMVVLVVLDKVNLEADIEEVVVVDGGGGGGGRG